MTYGIILAERAAKVAMCQKDRARTVTPNKWTFLTEVGREGTHLRKGAGVTKTLFVFGAVNTTVAWANRAGLKPVLSFLNFLLKEAVFEGFKIG